MNLDYGRLYMWQDLPPGLSNEESISYIKKYRETGDKKIRDFIVFGNMRLVADYITKHGANIYQIGKASDFEDVAQEAAVVISNAIEAFDIDKKIKFTTFVCVSVRNMFRNKFRKVREEKAICSLNEKALNDSEDEYLDIIETSYPTFTDTQFLIEYQFIKNNILCLLPKREREIYHDFYVKNFPAIKIAAKYGVTRHYIDKILQDTKERIVDLYENGISDYDKFAKGIKVSAPHERRIKQNLAILKKYSPEFLRKHFVPILKPNQAKIFENMVLNFYGQSYKYIEKTTQVAMPQISILIKSSINKLNKSETVLYKAQKTFKAEEIKNTKQVDFANKIISKYNGKMFLYKYFVSVLTENERKVFSAAVMDYVGQDYLELAKKCRMSLKEFKQTFFATVEKLKKYDFDMAIDIIENASLVQKTVDTLTLDDLKKAKARINLIKEKGGVLKFKAEVFPKLSNLKKQIAQDLYLHPKYSNIQSFAEQNQLDEEKVVETEKEFVENFLVK